MLSKYNEQVEEQLTLMMDLVEGENYVRSEFNQTYPDLTESVDYASGALSGCFWCCCSEESNCDEEECEVYKRARNLLTILPSDTRPIPYRLMDTFTERIINGKEAFIDPARYEKYKEVCVELRRLMDICD